LPSAETAVPAPAIFEIEDQPTKPEQVKDVDPLLPTKAPSNDGLADFTEKEA
jgi:hypothetical protein